MVRSVLTRAALLGATAWLAAAGATGTIAWRAVSVLDAGGESTGLLSTSQVRTALGDAQAMAAATPRPVASSSATPTAPSVPGNEIARTWAVAGGTVAAACTGTSIGLLYATPQDGWTVEVHSPGPAGLEVELHRGPQEIIVRAQCVDGEPVQQIDESGDLEDGTAPAPAPAPAPRQPASTPTTEHPSTGTPSTGTPTPRPSASEHDDPDDDHASPSPSPSSEPRG